MSFRTHEHDGVVYELELNMTSSPGTYVGVRASGGKFQARVQCDGRQLAVGTYETETDAAIAVAQWKAAKASGRQVKMHLLSNRKPRGGKRRYDVALASPRASRLTALSSILSLTLAYRVLAGSQACR